MAIHSPDINRADAQEIADAFHALTKRLLLQAAQTKKLYDQWHVLVETGTDGVSAAQDQVLAAWYFLEKWESALEPFWAAGYPKPPYPRPDFLAEIKRITESPWDAWQKQARLHTDPENASDTGIAAYRQSTKTLLEAAKQANLHYNQWRAAAEIGADPAQTAELQSAALKAWHQLELSEYEFKKFTDAGFPPVRYERPAFTESVQAQIDPWSAWADAIDLQSRVSHSKEAL